MPDIKDFLPPPPWEGPPLPRVILMSRKELEEILVEYRKGLITEQEKNDMIFDLLYRTLYPEQFPTR